MSDEAIGNKEVPFYERGNISKRDLAELRLKIQQADQEYEKQDEMIRCLIEGLGQDVGDWDLTLDGAKDLIRFIVEEIAGGKVLRDDFGEVEKGTIAATVFDLGDRIVELTREQNELRGLLDCRAGKLLQKGKRFVVVAVDEPYFMSVYAMIRRRENEIERWTEADEKEYQAAFEEWSKTVDFGKLDHDSAVDLEVERVFTDFWADIVLLANGQMDEHQVKCELFDFHTTIEEVSKAYGDITMGRLSKPDTRAEYVIDVVNERLQNEYRDGEKDAQEALGAEIATYRKAVQAEFEFYGWYMTAKTEDIIGNVDRLRREMQELCREALKLEWPKIQTIGEKPESE